MGLVQPVHLSVETQVSVSYVPRSQNVMRVGRGSHAEAGPGALRPRSPRCQRYRRLPWQIPGAHRWSGEGGERRWGFSPQQPLLGTFPREAAHPQPSPGWCWPPWQCCERCSRRPHPLGAPRTQWSGRQGRCSAGSSATRPPAGRPGWGTVGAGRAEGWTWDQKRARREVPSRPVVPGLGECWWGWGLAGGDQIPTPSWPTGPWDLGEASSLPLPSSRTLEVSSPPPYARVTPTVWDASLRSPAWALLVTTVHGSAWIKATLTPRISFLLPKAPWGERSPFPRFYQPDAKWDQRFSTGRDSDSYGTCSNIQRCSWLLHLGREGATGKEWVEARDAAQHPMAPRAA